MVREYGYEYDAALNESLWAALQGEVTSEKLFGAWCLRSGRDALKAVAREYAPCSAYLPALSCDSMVRPFEQYGHKVIFYRLRPDYSIDLDDLRSKLGRGPSLFLYMGYFGRSAISDEDLGSLKRSNPEMVFIEDRTHDLIWPHGSAFRPDYIMASLRKWLPVPDGGLLWGDISKPLGTDTVFSSTRLKAQCMRHEFLNCGDENLKTEYRRIFSTVSDLMDQDEPSAMSAYSYALAKETDWDYVRSARKANAEALISALSSSGKISFIQDTPGLSDLYVPFTVRNRDEVQRRLSRMGIFNTIIWPLMPVQKEVCDMARFTEENMLAAPCDQRYTADEMKYIGSEIVRVIADVER